MLVSLRAGQLNIFHELTYLFLRRRLARLQGNERQQIRARAGEIRNNLNENILPRRPVGRPPRIDRGEPEENVVASRRPVGRPRRDRGEPDANAVPPPSHGFSTVADDYHIFSKVFCHISVIPACRLHDCRLNVNEVETILRIANGHEHNTEKLFVVIVIRS